VTLRVIDGGRGDDEDDDLDAFARRDEDPREATGYVTPRTAPAVHPTLEPRGPARKVGALFYTVVEREDCRPEERGGPVGGEGKKCRDKSLGGCGEPANILHATGDDPRRLYCGACQGRINRERVGWGQAAEPSPEPRGKR
jgi:hypothetical protein